MTGWNALLSRARNSEDGFGIAEFMIAFGVILTVLIALLYTVASGFNRIGFARQRQAANGLAAQLIEQARGVAYAEIEKGLETTLLTGDPNVVPCGTQQCFAPSGEEIVHSNRPAVAPLKPHRVADVQIEQTTLDRAVYVTKAPPSGITFDPAKHPYRVIAQVTWDTALAQGPQPRVETETLIFSPEGCRSTATHPFAAPCQPFLYGVATAPSGSVAVTDRTTSPPQYTGTVLTTSARADVQDEQVARILGTTSAATLRLGANSSGGASVATVADSDIATTEPTDRQSTSSTPPAGSLSPSSGLSLTQSASDSLTSVSDAAAAASGTHECPISPGPPREAEDDPPKPCGYASATQGGTIHAELTKGAAGTSLVTRVAEITAPGSGSKSAFVDRDEDETTDTNPGKMIAIAARSLGDVRFGGLPSGTPALSPATPSAEWKGYLMRRRGPANETGGFGDYSDSATAASGTDTPPTSATICDDPNTTEVVEVCTIEFWNGTAYDSIPVDNTTDAVPFGSDQGGGLRQFTWSTTTTSGTPVNVTISGSIQSGGRTIEDPDAEVPPEDPQDSPRRSAEASVAPPLVGTLRYVITQGSAESSSTVADFDVVIDLGTLSANTTYQEAPTE